MKKSSLVLDCFRAFYLEKEVRTYNGKALNIPTHLCCIPFVLVGTKNIRSFILRLNHSGALLALTICVIALIPAYLFIWLLIRTSQCTRYSTRKLPPSVYLHLSTSRNLCFVDHPEKPICALTVPFHKLSVEDKTLTTLNLYNFTRPKDVLKAAWFFFNYFLLVIQTNQKDLLWLLPLVPDWFLLHLVLERNCVKSIWFSNHYDRWAALIDSIPGICSCMVQHGDLRQTVKGREIFFKPSHPFKRVKLVFVRNACSARDFSEFVSGDNVRFIKFITDLKFCAWPDPAQDKLRLFIIGSPSAAVALPALLSHFDQSVLDRISIVYRPHPREKIPIQIPFNNLYINHDPLLVPKPDLLLDYGSSYANDLHKATPLPVIVWDVYCNKDYKRVARSLSSYLDDLSLLRS